MPVIPVSSPNTGGRIPRQETEITILRDLQRRVALLEQSLQAPLQISVNAATSAIIYHQLNRYPASISCWDGAGHLVDPLAIQATDLNTVSITFPSSFTGTVSIF